MLSYPHAPATARPRMAPNWRQGSAPQQSNQQAAGHGAMQPHGPRRFAPQAQGQAQAQPPVQQASLPMPVKKVAETEGSIVVFSTAEKDEIGIRTLVGEYKQEGNNHGRSFFRKSQKIPGHEDIDVYLYFWDQRDGPAFSGWWFGNQVGGAQVWSRNRQTSMMPPQSGWTIPWDGEVKKELLVMGTAEKRALDQKAGQTAAKKEEDEDEAGAAAAGGVDEWEERIQNAAVQVATVEIDVAAALEAANAVVEGGSINGTSAAQAAEALAAQVSALAELQRFMAVEGLAAQKAPGTTKAEMTALGARVRKLQQTVKDEQLRVRSASLSKVRSQEDELKRAEEEAAERQLEGAHSKQLQEMMPAAMEKVDVAEDEVEKVAIAAAPLQIDMTDDLRPVMMQAIKETELRVRAAQAAVAEARRFITQKITQAQRFIPSQKKAALEEFTALQAKLNDAQEKLNPYKNVRTDYEARMQGKKLLEDLSGKLAGAEIEVEKAAMMMTPIGGDTDESMKETEAALTIATSALSQTCRLIESKMKSTEKAKGPLFEDVKLLQDRAKQATEKLDEVRRTVKETQVRIAADSLLREVTEKVSHAEDELQRMAEAELPFLKGDKDSDMESIIAEADKTSGKVHAAIADAQTFVARKLVEVARFTEGPAKAVREEIDMLQKRLEEGRDRLQQFRSNTGDRKRAFLLQEVEAKVSNAETEVKKMADAVQALDALGGAGETISEAYKETVEHANLAERSAQSGIVVARKQLLQKTAELKKLAIAGTGSGTELGKLQTRVNNMQGEITRLRQSVKEAEEKVRVKQMLAEVALRLQAAEAEAERVSASIDAGGSDDQPASEVIEKMQRATSSAQTKLSATAKLVDVKLRSAHGFLKVELTGMRERLMDSEKKLDEAAKIARESRERLEATDLIAQSSDQVEKAEAVTQAAAEAELPFLKGVEVVVAAEGAIHACEVANTAGQQAVSDVRCFLLNKLAVAEQFSSGPSQTCAQELGGLQKRLDACAGKLAELKKDTSERKSRAQMQAGGAKLRSVELAVQKLSSAMEPFGEERTAMIAPDEARAACEAIQRAEQQAQSEVAEARKFLFLCAQETKNYGETQRTASTVELGKLQGRLTQFQVEIATLSKQCKEWEQRFVSQKLVSDAEAVLTELVADGEAAAKAAGMLTADDKSEFLKSLHLRTLAHVLEKHMEQKGAKVEDIFGVMTKQGAASKADFVAFCNTLPEFTGNIQATFTEEQAGAMYTLLVGTESSLTLLKLSDLFKDHKICSVRTTLFDKVDEGSDIGTIEVGEGIKVLQTKEKGSNLVVRCILARDGAQVWAVLRSPDGENFRDVSSTVGRMESIEAFITGAHRRCLESAAYVDRTTATIAREKIGPLSEARQPLMTIRQKVGGEQSKVERVKASVAASKGAVYALRTNEIQKLQEARCKTFGEKSVNESREVVAKAEEKATKTIESAQCLTAETIKEASIAQLGEIKKASDESLQLLGEAKFVVRRALGADAFEGPSKNLLIEARVALSKLSSQVLAVERKCKSATESVRSAHAKAVRDATDAARKALRASARSAGQTSDELFSRIACGKSELSQAQLIQFAKTVKDEALTEEHVQLVYTEFGPQGLKRSGFGSALQEFRTCSQAVSITDRLQIAGAATKRKLETGEVFEVLEGPMTESDSNMERVRGRALRDGMVGWVSIKGSQGALLLRPAEKPFLWCTKQAPMMTSLGKGDTVRTTAHGEILELLAGPSEKAGEVEVLLHGKASMDGSEGWFVQRRADGSSCASPSKRFYVCKSSIAMTDNFDIKACRVLRKVVKDEILEVVDGEASQEDNTMEINRMRFKALRDGKIGWVTLTGNQGTVFVEASKHHFVIDVETALRETRSRDSKVLRTLARGEAFETVEAPKEERLGSSVILQVRAVDDDKVGWMSFQSGGSPPVRPWTAKILCRASVALTPTLAGKDSDAVRMAEPGEKFDAVDHPTLDVASGLRKVRCATAADGVVGWAAIGSVDGLVFLEPQQDPSRSLRHLQH